MLLPGLLVASAYFGWTDIHLAIQLLIAAVVFIELMTVSLYALVWSYWSNKRLKAVYNRMELLSAEIKAGKQPCERP